MKRNHLEELNQKCCYCGEKSSSNWNILRHIRIVHFDIRKFPCPTCNHRFAAKSDVDKHINSVHLKSGQKIKTIQSSNSINNVQPIIEMNPPQKLKKLDQEELKKIRIISEYKCPLCIGFIGADAIDLSGTYIFGKES